MSIAHHFHRDEGNRAELWLSERAFLACMLYTVTLVVLEIIIHRGWKGNAAVMQAPECVGAEVQCLC